MPSIHYLKGDATLPQCQGPAVIAHICNDQGLWAKGFVLALRARWPQAEQAYREWYRCKTWQDEPFGLGAVQWVEVAPQRAVANLVAQHGVRPLKGVPPLRYGALETCLHKLLRLALQHQSSVHMPRIGCGLAGGTWDKVGPLVSKMLAPVEVYVYDPE